ncbi:M14 family metallopeptidase, partial [Ruminococcaceae bacterium OttesenSCG-928-N02]|nr:M14 family metallopeptidase [Ruminococcaceae bacterium OttesenSCG-928-N02]
TNTKTGPALSKPAFYVDGNHHAGEVTGSMAALHLAVKLAQEYGVDAGITQLLDTSTVYVIPRITPDGAQAYLTSYEQLRSVNRPYPHEKPAPGLHPKDMDGDGVIRLMRVQSETGTWKPMDKDPRIMVKRAPGDFGGTYYNVYPEGYIEGYDGVNIQPAENKWGLDFNRNYPLGWFPEVRQPGAGKYPLSNPENKAVADFVLAHPNICCAVTYHTSGGCYIYPPGTMPEKNADGRDMRMYREIGKMATEETGYGCFNIFDAFLTDTVNYSSGAFDDWMYSTQGILTYTAELWDLALRAGVPNVYPRTIPMTDEEGAQQMYLCYKWIDENVRENVAVPILPWTEFEHPQLGKVEIGSLDFKYNWQNCPVGYLQAEVEKNTNFCLRMAQTLPRVKITSFEAQQTQPGVYKVKALVQNAGYLPTFVSNEALRLKVAPAFTAQLHTGAGEILAGKASLDMGHLEGFSGVNSTYSYNNINTFAHAPFAKELTWVVAAKPGEKITLSVGNAKSGNAVAEVVLV